MNIVLLDRSSNPVTKSGVTGVNLITDSGEEKIFEPVFEMSSAYFYFLRATGTENQYLILEKSVQSGGSTGKLCALSANYCQTNGYLGDNGEYLLGVLVSKNPNFEVGSTYSLSTLLNG